jgi:hypothetical protein
MPVFQAITAGQDQLGVQLYSGALGARFDSLARPRAATTPAPTAVVGAGAGTGATVTSVTGTDSVGNVTIQTGTSPAAGTVVTVTFSTPFTTAPFVQLEPKDSGGAAALYYVNSTTTTFTVKTVNVPPASTAVSFDYTVTGGA